MNKVLAILVLAVAFISCESDVKLNDPGFQGRKDNYLWRADLSTATVADGYMYVYAYKGLEEVILRFPAPSIEISSLNPVTYTFHDTDGDNSNDEIDDVSASYSVTDSGIALDYYTGLDSELDDPGNVEVTITRYIGAEGAVSGKFKFNAKYGGDNALIPDNVNFQEGMFFNTPIN